MPEAAHHGSDAVEIILDSSGLVLSLCAPDASRRLVADVAEGESLQTHVHPEDYDFFLWSAQWIMNGAHRQQTIRLRWARAAGRWSNVNATLRSESEETITIEFRPDEIDQAQRTEAQLRRIVEGSAQGIIVRTNTDVLYTNEAFAHMAGFASAKEMRASTEADMAQGRNLNYSGSVHPDDREKIAEHMRRRLSGEEAVSHYEFRLQRADGSITWVETHAALTKWDGQPASLSWLTDINHRKTMEMELVRSKEAAELANRTKTEFLANMSHELRTPLNAIIGFAEVIKDELFGPISLAKYADYAKDIHNSGRHLLDLINDILDLAKLESGKVELREDDVAIGETVSECLTLVRNRAADAKVKLATEIEPGLPLLHCDERALKQVLLNFLSNAVKFTPEGGCVTTAVRRLDGGIAISVTDTGIGMKKDDIKIALEAFGQVDSKIARKHQGTGLGLPISKSLIELHGGRLLVDSEPNVGTTMTAVFPLSRVVQAKAA